MKQNVKNDIFVFAISSSDELGISLLKDKMILQQMCKFKENYYGFLGNGKQNTETQAIKIHDTGCFS